MLKVIKTIVRVIVVLFILTYFYSKKKGTPLDLVPIKHQFVVYFEERPVATVIGIVVGIVVLLILLF